MGLFSLEHTATAYWADFALHGSAAALLAAALVAGTPPDMAWQTAWLLPLGGLGWTLIEYLLHHFVLHGLPPFSRWHALHHARPRALICGPTVLSSALITGLVFAPAWALLGLRPAAALTLGVLLGYLAYGLMHHATHHWRADARWLKRQKHWHGLHHHAQVTGYFGVTTRLWDHVFVSAPTSGHPGPTNGASPATTS